MAMIFVRIYFVTPHCQFLYFNLLCVVSELLEWAELAPGMFGGQVRTHEDGMITEAFEKVFISRENP